MNLGAVIVTYNSASTIVRCVRSLWASAVTNIVVVDNASTDETLAVVKKLGLTVLALPQNTGFASACNSGALLAGTSRLLFLNPDAYLTAGALQQAVKTLQRDPSIGAVGLVLQNEKEEPELESFGRNVTLGELIKRKQTNQTLPLKAQEVGWASAGALLVRGAAFKSIEGFDKNFFMYWEDIDLARRLQAAGWRVILEPRARVFHRRGGSLADLKLKTKLYDQAADRYFRKHYATPIWLTQLLWRKTYRLFSWRVR